jgi:hypothetical protein
VGYLRFHLLTLAALAVVLALVVSWFGFVRPVHVHDAMAEPPDSGLSYTKAAFTSSDAKRAFSAEGIPLSFRSRTTGIVTLGNRGDLLEVDAFGPRAQVERAGFSDYTTAGLGAAVRYVRFPRTCSHGGVAERWHANVRVMVDCAKAGTAAPRWLQRVERALARL